MLYVGLFHHCPPTLSLAKLSPTHVSLFSFHLFVTPGETSMGEHHHRSWGIGRECRRLLPDACSANIVEVAIRGDPATTSSPWPATDIAAKTEKGNTSHRNSMVVARPREGDSSQRGYKVHVRHHRVCCNPRVCSITIATGCDGIATTTNDVILCC